MTEQPGATPVAHDEDENPDQLAGGPVEDPLGLNPAEWDEETDTDGDPS